MFRVLFPRPYLPIWSVSADTLARPVTGPVRSPCLAQVSCAKGGFDPEHLIDTNQLPFASLNGLVLDAFLSLSPAQVKVPRYANY